MRIARISLIWFRGAASEAVLLPEGASIYVFGENGAGKSSFVDAIESCVNNGKVTHLAHEYSGRNQERGLINTHRPQDASTSVKIVMADGEKEVACKWAGAGRPQLEGLAETPIDRWDYRRTALRQEEVADFIRATKAEKYSALLPLLGLSPLETAAENLRRIAREVLVLSKADTLRYQIRTAQDRRTSKFGNASNAALLECLSRLHTKYDIQDNASFEPIITAIDNNLASLGAKSKEAATLREIAENELHARIRHIRELAAEIALLSEPFVKERLDVLNAAALFDPAATDATSDIRCPACGSCVHREEFRAHVTSERERLQNIDSLFQRHAEALGAACDETQRIKNAIVGPNLTEWRIAQADKLRDAFAFVESLTVSSLRTSCNEADLSAIETQFTAIISLASMAAASAPPDARALLDDKELVDAIRVILAAEGAKAQLVRIESLIEYTLKLEEGIRVEIREQARRVFDNISDDIQRLWGILHPAHLITNVRLHVPLEADKAIDVALKFYGVDQDSPRLTLSEGQRNALGLCIFLAMAKKATGDTPIILDDVVISMDRGHRSHVSSMLETEFADRQIILFTHEREWFFELNRFLRKPKWTSARLLPWINPQVGIRVATQTGDFEKAREKITTDPEDAESNVRRIMDRSLPEIA